MGNPWPLYTLVALVGIVSVSMTGTILASPRFPRTRRWKWGALFGSCVLYLTTLIAFCKGYPVNEAAWTEWMPLFLIWVFASAGLLILWNEVRFIYKQAVPENISRA